MSESSRRFFWTSDDKPISYIDFNTNGASNKSTYFKTGYCPNAKTDIETFEIVVGGGDDQGGQRNFTGLCTRLAIWNRTLTTEEIAQDFTLKNNGAIASDGLIRFYGGLTNVNGECINYVDVADGHTLVPYGNAMILTQVIS